MTSFSNIYHIGGGRVYTARQLMSLWSVDSALQLSTTIFRPMSTKHDLVQRVTGPTRSDDHILNVIVTCSAEKLSGEVVEETLQSPNSFITADLAMYIDNGQLNGCQRMITLTGGYVSSPVNDVS